MAPKVFLSHASEDKDSFVIGFAKDLRSNGIDAWVDKWEIRAGDSLVDKIFEEGLKDASAVIIVLSKNSVIKPWVREELNGAIVKKINAGSRVIPVVLDNCEVPESLKSTKWVSFKRPEDYQSSLDEIISTIFGSSDKPALGAAPAYAAEFLSPAIGNHNKVDGFVTKFICDYALSNGTCSMDMSVFIKDGEYVIPKPQLISSLNFLDEFGTISLERGFGDESLYISTTNAGFEEYAITFIDGYKDKKTSVVSAIINESLTSKLELCERLDEPPFLIEHIIRTLHDSGYIKVHWSVGGDCLITHVSATLKRSLS